MLSFIVGESELARRIRSHPWETTELGPPAFWPEALKTLVGVMLEANQPMFTVWGPRQRLLYNDQYMAVLQGHHPDALGCPFLEVWREIAGDLRSLVEDAYAGRPSHTDDIMLMMERNGYPEETHFAYSYTPVRRENGVVEGFFCACIETTEQAKSSRLVRESEVRNRQIFDSVIDYAIVATDLAGRVTSWNEGAHRLLGWTEAEMRGGPVDRFFTPEDREGGRPQVEMRDALQTGRAEDERWHLRKDGERFYASGEMTVLRDAAEEPVGFVKVLRDRTAEHVAGEALRASEALARENIQRVQLALSAGAIIGTWLWDLPSDRFTVDEAFANAFGLDPALGREGLSRAQIVETVHPEDQADLADAIEGAIASGAPYAHQYRVRRADGRFYWIEANGRVEYGPDGMALNFPGVLLDVEARRAVEAERDRVAAELRVLNETLEQRVAERTAELMRAEELLRQSQKMEAVGQLTGGLAHDFNNLLAGISGSLELMQARMSQGRVKDVDRYISAAQGATTRAAALTHRLLAFSRRQTLDPKPTNVSRLVDGMEDLVRRTVGPAIAVEVVGTPALWSVLVDPPQLENALLNLCINARDAMPDGGRITIETHNKWLDEHAARERDLEPGQYLSLCVSDTGTGMPPDVIAKAFDPFFTTKPIGEGTGLGLSMIYGFARQSGGQVRIYSEVGDGTNVCIYLPRHYGDEAPDGVAATLKEAPRAEQGETVLVVDDEPTVRMLVTEVLEDLGYTAIEATDSLSGLKVLQSDVRIDLLVTDVGLPGGMNGRQMAEAGQVKRPGLKVLFITGYAENAVLGSGHLKPGMQVLTKPFVMESLATRIKDMISERP